LQFTPKGLYFVTFSFKLKLIYEIVSGRKSLGAMPFICFSLAVSGRVTVSVSCYRIYIRDWDWFTGYEAAYILYGAILIPLHLKFNKLGLTY
jgi:hypothetical protein